MTSEKNKDKKWEKVNALMKRDSKTALQEELPDKIALQKQMIKEPDGVIAKFKAHKIERKAVVELIKTWYESQLEVAKHQLQKAVQMKKQEADVETEHFLMDLNKRHLHYLNELEFSNLEERYDTLGKLGDSTAKAIEKITTRDWPPKMIEETIQGIMDLNRSFFEKIMKEQIG